MQRSLDMLAQLRRVGRALAVQVAPLCEQPPIVLAIPRRGLVVGSELARELRAPLDVLLVAKVGASARPIGALALGGDRVIDPEALAAASLDRAAIQAAFADARARLDTRLRAIRGDVPLPDLAGRTVVLVDDAIISGLTMRAALGALEHRGTHRIVIATPLASETAAARFLSDPHDGVALERLPRQLAEQCHEQASATICPPIADAELHEMLVEAWRVVRPDFGALELDGI